VAADDDADPAAIQLGLRSDANVIGRNKGRCLRTFASRG
jgi:hypothetical protein